MRLARRDWERARRVPDRARRRARPRRRARDRRLAAARADDDFAAFAPALQRNVELARARTARAWRRGRERSTRRCSATTTSGCASDELRRLFDCARRDAAAARGRGERALARRGRSRCRWPRSRRRWRGRCAGWASRTRAGAWTSRRIPSPPGWAARDTRVTTRYSDGDVESLLSSLHEYGHALYERQIDPALERTNLGHGTSMSIHESQSKLWENHVARSPAFAEVLAAELARRRVRGLCRGAPREPGRRRALADPRLGRPADLSAAHHPALRARARADRRRSRRARPARRLA